MLFIWDIIDEIDKANYPLMIHISHPLFSTRNSCITPGFPSRLNYVTTPSSMEYESKYCIILASHSLEGFYFQSSIYLLVKLFKVLLCVAEIRIEPGRMLLSDEEILYELLHRSLYFYCMFIIAVSKAIV